MRRLRRQLAALLLGAALLTLPAAAVPLTLNGAPLDVGDAPLYGDTTYVPLRSFLEALCPDARLSWDGRRATVSRGSLTLIAEPGESVLVCNGDRVSLPRPVLLEKGRTLVPVRILAQLLGYSVGWSHKNQTVLLTTDGYRPAYSEDDLYWLARIISAESRGECWAGKIAVGNVVLNRVASPEFPNTIYGVIFDDRWGGQFEPVRNGTVYNEPTEESFRAALACLNGENTVGDSLYFLAPHLTTNHWTMENRDYVTTIGVHWFYR